MTIQPTTKEEIELYNKYLNAKDPVEKRETIMELSKLLADRCNKDMEWI